MAEREKCQKETKSTTNSNKGLFAECSHQRAVRSLMFAFACHLSQANFKYVGVLVDSSILVACSNPRFLMEWFQFYWAEDGAWPDLRGES